MRLIKLKVNSKKRREKDNKAVIVKRAKKIFCYFKRFLFLFSKSFIT